MKKIPLTQNKFALVDDEDFDWLNQWKWTASKIGSCFYAVRRVKGKMLLLHRVIMNPDSKLLVDHRNGNGLDNQRQNLRICTQSQNLMNRGPQSNNSSGYKGVYWDKKRKAWRVQIKKNQKVTYLGQFNDLTEAAKAYDRAAKVIFGPFAFFNFPD